MNQEIILIKCSKKIKTLSTTKRLTTVTKRWSGVQRRRNILKKEILSSHVKCWQYQRRSESQLTLVAGWLPGCLAIRLIGCHSGLQCQSSIKSRTYTHTLIIYSYTAQTCLYVGVYVIYAILYYFSVQLAVNLKIAHKNNEVQ